VQRGTEGTQDNSRKISPHSHFNKLLLSGNMAGHPLPSLDDFLNYIRGTTTSTGLSVHATLIEKTYKKGQKVSQKQMDQLNIERHSVCPKWNYTLSPR
jgi:hypothetical protein